MFQGPIWAKEEANGAGSLLLRLGLIKLNQLIIRSTPNCTCVSNPQLQGAAILGQTVGLGTSGGGHGGHSSGRSLPGNLDCGPKQIDLFAVHVLHVVLQKIKIGKGDIAVVVNTLRCTPQSNSRDID